MTKVTQYRIQGGGCQGCMTLKFESYGGASNTVRKTRSRVLGSNKKYKFPCNSLAQFTPRFEQTREYHTTPFVGKDLAISVNLNVHPSIIQRVDIDTRYETLRPTINAMVSDAVNTLAFLSANTIKLGAT